jgi:para-nitrobenzyl esterase
VRDNIAQFGGDPGRVTLFGQSGGGAKIAALMAMPSCQGLFHRAIIQSGPAAYFMEPGEAERTAQGVSDTLAPGGARRRGLANVPTDALLQAQRQVLAQLAGRPLPQRRQFGFNPVVDGTSLACHPLHAMPVGLPVLIGSTEDEMSPVCYRKEWLAPHRSEAELFESTAPVFGWTARARSLAAAYRELHPDASSWALLVAAASAACVRNDLYRMADHFAAAGAQVYSYVFRRKTGVLGGVLGALHGIDVPYVFKRTPDSAMSRDEASPSVADAVAGAWGSLARNGEPRLATVGRWPRYEPASRCVVSFDATIAVENDPFERERKAWGALG